MLLFMTERAPARCFLCHGVSKATATRVLWRRVQLASGLRSRGSVEDKAMSPPAHTLCHAVTSPLDPPPSSSSSTPPFPPHRRLLAMDSESELSDIEYEPAALGQPEYKLRSALKPPRTTTYTAQALYGKLFRRLIGLGCAHGEITLADQIVEGIVDLEPEYQRGTPSFCSTSSHL